MRGVRINERLTNDEKERTRYSLSYQFDGEFPLASQVRASVYQESESVQFLAESRTPPPFIANQTRTRQSTFNQKSMGLQFKQLKKQIGDSDQTITYGMDYETTVETLRMACCSMQQVLLSLKEDSAFPHKGVPNH